MNKIITGILAGLFISLVGIVTLSEAQTMKNEGRVFGKVLRSRAS